MSADPITRGRDDCNWSGERTEPGCGYIEVEPGSAGWLCIFGFFQAGKCFPVQSLIDNSDCDGLDSGFEVEICLYTFDAQKRLFFLGVKIDSTKALWRVESELRCTVIMDGIVFWYPGYHTS